MHAPASSAVAGAVPEAVIRSLEAWVADDGGAEVDEVSFAQHSNDLAALRFGDGRTLMVKRGRYDWAAQRFANSREASRLLRQRVGIVAPEPLDVPEELDEKPVEVYWRIELPILAELWEDVSPAQREAVLRSWGELLRKIHAIRIPGWGPLAGGIRHPTLGEYLEADLGERLYPAAISEWAEGAEVVYVLLGSVPEVQRRVGGRSAVLAHSDVHMGNALCEVGPRGPRCVGMLDLEAAIAGPPEVDLAIADVLHRPLFQQPLPEGWMEPLFAGYGAPLDPMVLAFFRAYHLCNLGFFSALVGDDVHASEVAAAARREVERLHAG